MKNQVDLKNIEVMMSLIANVLVVKMPKGFDEDDRLHMIFDLTESVTHFCKTGEKVFLFDERTENLRTALEMKENNATH